MTGTSKVYGDILDSSSDRERERLRLLEDSFDPGTFRWLDQLGVGSGWRCLEVGAGGGSVARWLADRVGPSGHVVATDLRIDQLAGHSVPNLEVRVHNIITDSIENAHYDLIHLRFVLNNLADHRATLLPKLIGALRPGGWLLIEDPDFASFDGCLRDAPADLARWYYDWVSMLRKHVGVELYAGRRTLHELRAAGLVEVGSEGRVIMVGEGASSIEALAAAMEQTMPVLEPHGLSTAQGEAFLRFMRSSGFRAVSWVQMAGWGRRP